MCWIVVFDIDMFSYVELLNYIDIAGTWTLMLILVPQGMLKIIDLWEEKVWGGGREWNKYECATRRRALVW